MLSPFLVCMGVEVNFDCLLCGGSDQTSLSVQNVKYPFYCTPVKVNVPCYVTTHGLFSVRKLHARIRASVI